MLRKVFTDHIMVLANMPQKRLKRLADTLAESKQILAIEFLMKDKVFVLSASLEEMKKFKSKV